MYIVSASILIIIGTLYEIDILHKNEKYKETSWKYGTIGLLIVAMLLLPANIMFKKLGNRISKNAQSYIWYLSHIVCYFFITLASPNEWPFWFGIGVLWELFECYGPMCNFGMPISCSGFYDITANMTGIFIALWIRSEFII